MLYKLLHVMVSLFGRPITTVFLLLVTLVR